MAIQEQFDLCNFTSLHLSLTKKLTHQTFTEPTLCTNCTHFSCFPCDLALFKWPDTLKKFFLLFSDIVLNTWKITLFIFCSKIHFFFYSILLSFSVNKKPEKTMGANTLKHFPRVQQQDFIENSPWEACLCFTARTWRPWRSNSILKVETSYCLPKARGTCTVGFKEILCIWRNIPLIILTSETEPRHSETSVQWEAAGIDFSCSVNWPHASLERKISEQWLEHMRWAFHVPFVYGTLLFLLTLIES